MVKSFNSRQILMTWTEKERPATGAPSAAGNEKNEIHRFNIDMQSEQNKVRIQARGFKVTVHTS